MTIIAVFLRAVPAQTLESLPAAGKAQSVFPLNLPSPPSFVAELLRRTGTRGEERYAPVRPERLPILFVKLSAHSAGLPGKEISFVLCPLTPPIPPKAGQGTCRPQHLYHLSKTSRTFWAREVNEKGFWSKVVLGSDKPW